MAFDIADKHYGVTSLLDPKDIDVDEPDEKSIMTYVSSLYDVFPEVPSVEQSVRDNEKQLNFDEYRELASNLFVWLNRMNHQLLDFNFPNTVIEIRAFEAEFNRLQMDELPMKQAMKDRFNQVFNDLVGLGLDPDAADLDEELQRGNIERLWQRLLANMAERERAIQAEMAQLERLKRLSEKVHRECKGHEGSLDDVERRLMEDIERLHLGRVPVTDLKRSCDNMELLLQVVESGLPGMQADIQALREGHYHQAEQPYKRVYRLRQRCTMLHSRLQDELLSRLPHDVDVTDFSPSVNLREYDEAFDRIHAYLKEVRKKQIEVESDGFGADLESTSRVFSIHISVHKDIQEMISRIAKNTTPKGSLPGEEGAMYDQLYNELEVACNSLQLATEKRLEMLQSLEEMFREATELLVWLKEKEDIEANRDWTARDLVLDRVADYHKQLTSELETRKPELNDVYQRGEQLLDRHHPAQSAIKCHLAALTDQWSLVTELNSCLSTHLNNAREQRKFNAEASRTESWLDQQIQSIDSQFVKGSDMSPENAKTILTQLEALRRECEPYGAEIDNLTERSSHLTPVRKSQTVRPPIDLRCVCNYRDQETTIHRGEALVLVDSSQSPRWTVRRATGQQVTLPSPCVVIHTPDQEAISTTQRLRSKYERLMKLIREKQIQLRTTAVCATLRDVLSWDLKTFQSMSTLQREAVMANFNSDARSLLNDLASDPNRQSISRRIEHELDECNRLFAELAMASQDTSMKQPARSLLSRLDALSQTLEQLDKALHAMLQEPLPPTVSDASNSADRSNDLAERLHAMEPDLKSLQQAYEHLGSQQHSRQLESQLAQLVEKWHQLMSLSSQKKQYMKSIK